MPIKEVAGLWPLRSLFFCPDLRRHNHIVYHLQCQFQATDSCTQQSQGNESGDPTGYKTRCSKKNHSGPRGRIEYRCIRGSGITSISCFAFTLLCEQFPWLGRTKFRHHAEISNFSASPLILKHPESNPSGRVTKFGQKSCEMKIFHILCNQGYTQDFLFEKCLKFESFIVRRTM